MTLVSAHSNAGCICHGYSPNLSLNIRHNLTKDIYCTNCHSDYNSEGEIVVYYSPVVVAMNQSAHYITNNTEILYNHSYKYFRDK